MSDIVQFISDPFVEKWRGKYTVTWCHDCEVAIIICPHCYNSSCNGCGCEICVNDPDAKEFMECKTQVQCYLNETDKLIYEKALRIKRHILETLAKGEKQIDWKKCQEDGQLSEWEISLLSSLLH